MMIQRYFASLGIEVDKSSVKKVDKTLDQLENRLRKLVTFANKPIVLSIGSFDIDQRRLNLALGTALDIASTRVVFEINRFAVDQMHLNRVMTAATIAASRVAGQNATIRPNVHVNNTGLGGRHAAGAAVGGGLIGRGVSGLYGPAIGLTLGGYGLSNLNQRNQEVVAAQLQTQAVTQAYGGTAEQGDQNFQFLRNLGNKVGFNYLKAAPDFNNLTSNLLGSGGTQEQARNIFKGFAEYGRVNKLSAARQNLVFNALSQIAGKNALQAEELTKQLGNSLPGAKSLFADAYQRKIGGNLTGQEAIIALEAAMKKGQVKGDILNYAANIASERAAPGLAKASQASQAEQARYQNTISDLAVVASNAGVEEGFARIFRTLNLGLSESNGLVTSLAEGFNEATKWADDLLLFPQSFVRALEGKDSLVADWLGINKTSQLVQDWQTLKQIFTDIGQIKFDFLPTLEATAREIAGILNTIAQIQKFRNGEFPTELATNTDTVADTTSTIFNNIGVGLGKARERGRAVYDDPTSLYYQDPAGYDAFQRDMVASKEFDSQNGYNASQAANDSPSLQATGPNMQFDITLNVDPITMNQMDVSAQADALANEFKEQVGALFEQASVNFPIKQ